MKLKSTLLLLILLTLFGCKEKLPEEYRFFGNHNISSGDYKLKVIGTQGTWIENYRDFYIDDLETLERMQEQWVFNYKTTPMSCGYGYNIGLYHNDTLVESKSVNIECEYMSGWIYFPSNYLTDHIQSFKRMSDTIIDDHSKGNN